MEHEELNRAIGRLEGISEQFDKQQARAETSRKEVHDKLNQVVSSVEGMESKITHMDARLTELEPIVGQFSKWRERGIGVFLFLAFILTATGALIAALWDKALHFIGLK